MSNRSLGSLTIDVLARIGGFRQGMEQAERVATRSSRAIQTSVQRNIGDGFQSANNSVQEFTSRLVSMAAAYATIRTAISSADEWTNLGNRIRLVTNGSAEFEAAQSNIVNIARETRQSLSATGELYQRIATNQKELGLSGQEVADVVKTISQSLVISGASAQSAQAALIQLGQAFGSGVLRGQELNSVLEQAPALAKSIADGLGIPIGRLRELGAAGKLTATEVIAALQQQAGAVEDSFGKVAITVGQSLQVAKTNLTVFIGELDQASGASAALASTIASLSTNLPAVTTAFAAFASVKVAQNLGERATALARNRVELIASTKADLAAAQAAELSARANLLAAQADVRRAQSIGGSVSVSAQAAAATLTHRQATIALAAAQTQAAAATNILGGAVKSTLAFFGGPAGLLFLIGSTAASFLLFRNNASDTQRSLLDLNGTLDESIAKFNELNRAQQAGEILRVSDEISAGAKSISESIALLTNEADFTDLYSTFGASLTELQNNFNAGKINADEFANSVLDLGNQLTATGQIEEAQRRGVIGYAAAIGNSAREVEKKNSILDLFVGKQKDAANAVDGTSQSLRNQQAELQAGQAALTKYVADLAGQVEKANISLIRKTKGEFAALQVEVGNVINAAGGVGALSGEQRKQINEFLETRKRQIEQEQGLDSTRRQSQPARAKEIEDGASLIEQLKERIALFGVETEVARVAYDLQNGGLSNLTQARKDEALALAAQLDLLHEEEAARKEVADAQNEQYHAALQQKAAISDYLSDLEFEIELMRMSNGQRETAIALRRLGVEQGSDEARIISDQIAKTREQASALSDQIEVMDSIRDAGKGLFIDLAEGSKSFKDSFIDALDSIRKRLIALAAEKLIDSLLGQIGTIAGGAAAGRSNSKSGTGSRANGGPVFAGGLYEVGENGRPEILTDARGKQYLIPGNNSNVSPLSNVGGFGGTNVSVVVNNKGAPINVESQSTRQSSDGRIFLDLITSTVQSGFNNGAFDGALGNSFGIKRAGRG
ncbi:tail tip protein [Stenotrophomonas phage SOVA965]